MQQIPLSATTKIKLIKSYGPPTIKEHPFKSIDWQPMQKKDAMWLPVFLSTRCKNSERIQILPYCIGPMPSPEPWKMPCESEIFPTESTGDCRFINARKSRMYLHIYD